MLKKLIIFLLVILLLGGIAGSVVLGAAYFRVTRDLPDFQRVDEYSPPAVSRVYANDGTLVAEFFKERRYPVKISDIPVQVRQAFLAAEDASFYSHPGIDPMSIVRALVKNLRTGHMSQGGSTITQQVVKNLLLTSEKSLTRKIREALLAYRLENRLSKDEIFELYLNQIFFGNTAYGIKAAARSYFHKELQEITLAEAALLAGLPKAPTAFSPLVNPKRARIRQHYVLDRMVEAGFISKPEANLAKAEEVKVYPATYDTIYEAPYYVAEVRRVFQERWPDLNLDEDGLEIHTALDLSAYRLAERALRKGLREVDKRRGWRGPLRTYPVGSDAEYYKDFSGRLPKSDSLEAGEVYPALVKRVSAKGVAEALIGKNIQSLNLREAGWAKKRLGVNDRASFVKPEEQIRPGDVVEASLEEPDPNSKKAAPTSEAPLKVKLDQTPDIESSLVVLDPFSGKVIAVIGGYSYQRSVFNRATQGLRQPGSSFKPIVYLTAVEKFHYTPATIVYDTPRSFRVGDEVWTPGNFDGKYMGAITLRTALQQSRNLVSADIVSRIGLQSIIEYARKLGIASPLGSNPSLALGSSEVTLLELARAYGVFPARGVLFDSVFVTKLSNRSGEVIFDYDQERISLARQVISEQSAFIMANMMKGVVEHGTGYKVKELGRPAAGKTGTTNDEMDAWFIGYTPEWVCGVWTGFDQKKHIGEKETGGRVSAPTFLYFMRDFLAEQDRRKHQNLVDDAKSEAARLGIKYVEPEPVRPQDFVAPSGVQGYWVDKDSGLLAADGAENAIYEYFIEGTEPSKSRDAEEQVQGYLESPEL